MKTTLPKKADQFIQALLEQTSTEKAAASVGISESTAWRWLRHSEFRQKFLNARREAFSRSVARLQGAASVAVTTLIRVMVDKDTPAASKVRAADSVLGHAANALELEDLEMRISRMEKANEDA